MHIHIIQHESFEAPGAFITWIQQKQHTYTTSHLYLDDALPDNSESFDMLLIMGGPQSPYSSLDEFPHFDTVAEQAVIKQAIDDDKIVLGVCLGAQMISNALGANTTASPNKEIGLLPVILSKEGLQDTLFSDFPTVFDCGHWHGDMPGLTDDAIIIAQSDGCPRQIVRYGPKVYGLQCHFEFTAKDINNMITNCHEELEREKDKPYVQSPEQLIANDYSSANHLLFIFLDRLTSHVH